MKTNNTKRVGAYHYHWINPAPWSIDGDADSYKKRCYQDHSLPHKKQKK